MTENSISESPVPKNTIPKNPSKSKIKPLKEKISSLEKELKQTKDAEQNLLEELYESGVRQRPTIMSQIEVREELTLKTIQFIITECEKETGRSFPWEILA